MQMQSILKPQGRSTQASMHNSNSHQIKNTGLCAVSAILTVCVLISGFILCLRIGSYTYAKKADTDIPIVRTDNAPSDSTPTQAPLSENTQNISPGFQVSDDSTVWSTDTDIELFRAYYENGERMITAAGTNNEKIVAPGTQNEYIFRLSNTGNTPIKYNMVMKAMLFDGEKSFEIPLSARLYDYKQNYLLGEKDAWAGFERLNDITHEAVLAANSISYYTLEWQWPYESGNDPFDTLLGNISVDRELVLSAKIEITARLSDDYGAAEGIPDTGDTNSLRVYVAIALGSGTMLILLFIANNREKKNEQ